MHKDYTEIDLENAWKDLSQKRFGNKILEKEEIMEAIKSKSGLNIISLKKSLKIKASFCFAFVFLFILIALLNFDYNYNFTGNEDSYFHLLFAFIYAVGSFILYKRYKKMDDGLNSENSLLDNLKHNKATIQSALFVERIWGILAMILLYAFYFSRWTTEASSPKALIIRIGIFFSITVVLMYIAELMNKKKFGSKIKELEEDIIRLELLE